VVQVDAIHVFRFGEGLQSPKHEASNKSASGFPRSETAMNTSVLTLASHFFALLLCLVLCMPHAHAADAAPIPPFTSLIVDQVKLLNDDERSAIETRLKSIQASGRAQIGILVATGTGDESLAQYSLRVAEAWQLGRKDKDNGLLILLVPSKNAARIEVGYGLEGSIPDARASSWLDDLLQSLKHKDAAAGLSLLLDKIDKALPQSDQKPAAPQDLLDAHPEWKLPFVLVVFSLFTLFPLFIGRWGGVISAPLLATMYGFAAWGFWESNTAGYIAAALAFPLPLLWSLNKADPWRLGPVARCGLIIGNLCGVLLFFAILTLFVGMGLYAGGADEVWAAPLFAFLMATGVAVFLFPGAPAHYLMLFLRSFMHFLFVLAVAYFALLPIYPQPTLPAFGAAALFTVLVAIGLLLDSRETKTAGSGETSAARRWSLWFFAAAIVLLLPFAVVMLIYAVLGDDLNTRIAQASAGGGSLAAVIWWAARQGFFSLAAGLGGKFGGGGAGRDG
jgi:uncharacterized protein